MQIKKRADGGLEVLSLSKSSVRSSSVLSSSNNSASMFIGGARSSGKNAISTEAMKVPVRNGHELTDEIRKHEIRKKDSILMQATLLITQAHKCKY